MLTGVDRRNGDMENDGYIMESKYVLDDGRGKEIRLQRIESNEKMYIKREGYIAGTYNCFEEKGE